MAKTNHMVDESCGVTPKPVMGPGRGGAGTIVHGAACVRCKSPFGRWTTSYHVRNGGDEVRAWTRTSSGRPPWNPEIPEQIPGPRPSEPVLPRMSQQSTTGEEQAPKSLAEWHTASMAAGPLRSEYSLTGGVFQLTCCTLLRGLSFASHQSMKLG